MSGSRIIEISQPSELEYVKKIIISHSFRITRKIQKKYGKVKGQLWVSQTKNQYKT